MSRRPDPMPRWQRWRSNVIQAPLFFVATGFFGSLALAASLFARTGRTQHRIARLWAKASVAASGARLMVRGAENLAKAPVAVYAANHTSYMDTPVIFASLPFQFRILAKKELWSLPFIGWYLARSGQIPIDAENPRSALSSLSGGVKALRKGMPLFVFPEGSRTPDGETKAFMAGAAYLAIRAQVPLVPIALSGVYDVLPIHTTHFFPNDVVLTVGGPIDTTGMTPRQTEELTEKVRSEIVALLGSQAPAESAVSHVG